MLKVECNEQVFELGDEVLGFPTSVFCKVYRDGHTLVLEQFTNVDVMVHYIKFQTVFPGAVQIDGLLDELKCCGLYENAIIKQLYDTQSKIAEEIRQMMESEHSEVDEGFMDGLDGSPSAPNTPDTLLPPTHYSPNA